MTTQQINSSDHEARKRRIQHMPGIMGYRNRERAAADLVDRVPVVDGVPEMSDRDIAAWTRAHVSDGVIEAETYAAARLAAMPEGGMGALAMPSKGTAASASDPVADRWAEAKRRAGIARKADAAPVDVDFEAAAARLKGGEPGTR